MKLKRDAMMQLFRRLTNIPGGSGFEEKVIEAIYNEIKINVPEVTIDLMGNVIARLGKGKRSVMVTAHVDEICMLVKYIDPKGYIYFYLNGMIDERGLPGTMVDICTGKGILTGLIGVKNRHLLKPEDLKKPITLSDLWVDIGAESEEEVWSKGVEIGDPIVFHPNFLFTGEETIMSKAIDNRVGCAILIDLVERIIKEDLDYKILFVFTVQEEIGSRGAKVVAQALQPDIAIVIDTVPALDPATLPKEATSECGKGPVIRTMDVNDLGLGTIYSKKIRERLIATAKNHNIPYQMDIFRTWTDASTIHMAGKGIPCGGIFIPRRYSHSPLELVRWSDVIRSSDLLYHFLKELHSTNIEDIIQKI